jgi:hypothetical protein
MTSKDVADTISNLSASVEADDVSTTVKYPLLGDWKFRYLDSSNLVIPFNNKGDLYTKQKSMNGDELKAFYSHKKCVFIEREYRGSVDDMENEEDGTIKMEDDSSVR